MDHPEVFLTDNPDEEARWLIDHGLGDYNAKQAGYWDPCTLAVLVRDEVSGRVVDGMLGRTSLLLFIDLVYLPGSCAAAGSVPTCCKWPRKRRCGVAAAARCFTPQFPGTGLLPTAWLAGICPLSL
jgi:hypothetical protein